MKTLTIDRLEGIYAICMDKEKRYFAIPVSELPQGAAAGDKLTVDDEAGAVSLEKAAALKRNQSAK